MRIGRRRVTERYVITLTSVTIVLISLLCAGTYASWEAPPAPAMAPPCMSGVLSSAAPHMTITAALDMMSIVLLILAAQAAHLPTRVRTVLTVNRSRRAPQDVTIPSNKADTLEMMLTFPVLMVAVSR